jgi:protoporphyrinogen oxidase
MVTGKYDVVIIGAGAAGLTIGAVLAAKEGKRVLVVEKEEELGGRLASFVGEKDAVSFRGKKLNVQEYQDVLRAVYTWVVRTKPDLPTMIEQGLLNGYTFEAGVHATFWGDKGRVACVLDYLGKHLDLPGNEGFAIIDPKDNKWYPIERHGKYGWMTEEANLETKRITKEMTTLSLKEAEKYDLISFGQWLNERTQNRQVYEYLAALASIHMVTGEPDLMPASDFLKFMAAAKDVGMNLVTGSTGTVGPPGFIEVTVRLAEAFRENGGEIMLGTPVTEVIIADKKAEGVTVQTKSGPQKIEAQSVVCTVPVKHIFGILPERHFPPDFVKKVKESYWGAGMLSGYAGLKRNIIEDKGVNPKSWLLVPSIIKADEGYIGDVDIITFMSSNFNPLRAPKGKHLWEFSIALTDKEMRDNSKVNRVIDEVTAFMQRNFPTWLEDMDWELWTASDEGYGIWPPIGERRPDVKSPWIEGLHFAGDGYGARRWGAGLDSAIHSAILCLDSVGSKDYSSEILPEYHR